MPGNGPAPKPNHRYRNADVYSNVQQTVVDDGELCGPALEGAWPVAVRGWYDIWRRSPQAKTFLITDWARLRMLAPLVANYLESPTPIKMAEIRQNESLLGATYVDRLKGRIKVEAPSPVDSAPVAIAVIDDYRRQLGA